MKRLLPLFLLLLALPMHAQVRCNLTTFITDPPRPRAGEPTDLRIGGGCPDGCIPTGGALTFEDRTIVITLDEAAGGCILSPQPWSSLIRLGDLPPGNYPVEVRVRGMSGTGVMDRRTLAVAESTRPFTIGPTWTRLPARTPVTIEMANVGECRQPPCNVEVTFGSGRADVTLLEPHRVVVVPPAGSGVVDVIVKTEREAVRARNAFGYFDASLIAPEPDWFERVLIPVLFNGPGARGAQWRTDVIVKNPTSAVIDPYYRSVFPPPDNTSIGMQPFHPGTSRVAQGSTSTEGMFLFLPRDEVDRLEFSIRIRDVSREAEDLGAEVPVVRARDTGSSIELISIPNDPRYRSMLRIYDFDSDTRDVFVTARWDARRLSMRRVQLWGSPNVPAFAQIDLRAMFPEIDAESFDVEVSRPGSRVWAFVSVTNDVTQRVTMLTPQ